jgi:alpha-galactosidase
VTPESLATLGNADVIAVDQDRLGRQGRRVRRSGGTETWVRELAGGSRAIVFVNRAGAPRQLSVRVDRIPRVPTASGYTVRDLWAHTERSVAAGETVDVPLASHEAVMWRVKPG